MTVIGAVIEARMSSSRLPGKVLTELIEGWPMIDLIVGRVKTAKRLDKIIVATSQSKNDDVLVQHCIDQGISVFRGSEKDVMERSLGAAQSLSLDWMVRLTGDNPFVDGLLLDDLITFCLDGQYDYAATTMMGHSKSWKAEREFPRGLSAEVVRVSTLETVAEETIGSSLREFTTFAVYDEPERWSVGAFPSVGRYVDWKYPDLRFTVDTPSDLELARSIFESLSKGFPLQFGTEEVIQLVANNPELAKINASIPHNVVSKLKETEN